MPAPNFPSSLREILRNSISEQPLPIWRANPTEIGPPLRAKLVDEAPSLFTVNWNFTEAEFSTFETWFKDVIQQGTSTFIIPIRTGAGVVDHECYFQNGNYRSRQKGKRTVIQAQLLAIRKIFP